MMFALTQVAAAGVQAIGFEHGTGLRGAARGAAGQERRGAVVRGGARAGSRAAAVSGVEPGVAGGPR